MSDTPHKVAVVTGGSRGIGRSVSIELGANGFFVYVNYRSRSDAADQTVSEIEKVGGKAKSIPFDVADEESVRDAFDKIAKEAGGVDVLVNNAGIAMDGLVLRAKKEDWDKQIQTNLYGAYLCTQAALKTMLRRKGDRRIIFLSSVVGQMGNAGQSIYSTTKAAIFGMTKSIAKEVASRDITVNAVAPGYVKTDMTEGLDEKQEEALLKMIPLRRWAESDEIAKVIGFLASREASYITGETIAVNGGMYL